ncbi:hypothetical protein BJX64DRAFT_295419 [Aspergillus heterothallicus]
MRILPIRHNNPFPVPVAWLFPEPGMRVSGSPHPLFLPQTYTLPDRRTLAPGTTHRTLHHITALPASARNGDVIARLYHHTTTEPIQPVTVRQATSGTRGPINAPARIPPIVAISSSRHRHRSEKTGGMAKKDEMSLILCSKRVARKVPGAFLAVLAPFLTQIFVKYSFGDAFCYVFPFWI